MIRITWTGIGEALGLLAAIAAGIRGIDGRSVWVVSEEPYAFGMETGFHRSGRLARRAGGSWAVRDAGVEIAPYAASQMAGLLAGSLRGVRPYHFQATMRAVAERARVQVVRNLGRTIYAQPAVGYRRTGRLRDSYRVRSRY